MVKKNSHHSRRDRARLRKQRQKRMQMGLLAVGLLLVLGGVYSVIAKKAATPKVDVKPEDIVYAEGLHAIHEMNGATLDQIPFLPKGDPQPQITIPEDFFNFGSIGPTDIATHDFLIVNTGDAPLTISRAYTTCACTTADFSATVIPPGKAVVMTISLDAGFHDVRGQTVRRGVIIENNDPKNPQMEIWTQAAVRQNP